MSNTATATRRTLADRLSGKQSFVKGPYKSAHVAHSFASQARARVKASGEAWEIAVDADKMVVRFRRAKGS